MPPRAMTSLPIGKPTKRMFWNRMTQLFFTELDKGITSPFVVFATGALLCVVGSKVLDYYVAPRQAQLAGRKPAPRISFADSHNVIWGLSTQREAATMEREGAVSRAVYAPQESNAASEADMRRPQLVASEVSELPGLSGAQNVTGEVDVVCLEVTEYDPQVRDDVFYRSVHYVPRDGVVASDSSKHPPPTPSHGGSVIHGMVKCKGVTSLNQCLPQAGQVVEEYVRKLLLTLGPVHILRDAAKTSLPIRFTMVKQPTIETLVLGLHSGELPRWLSRAFPNFNVSVVEGDGTLVRLCRRFLGFQESTNLRLIVTDPIQHVRRAAVEVRYHHETTPPYDLVLIDTVDGAGRLNTAYGHLEFIRNLRTCMSDNGCVALRLPNEDPNFVYNMVQNWRMGFAGRTVLLIHCVTAPWTILMTFQDGASRGKSNFGTVANVEEFQDLQRSQRAHYGTQRVPFDLVGEVSEGNLRILRPGERYSLTDYLPRGHPELLQQQQMLVQRATRGWQAWLRKVAGNYLGLHQRADMGLSGPST